jgi:GTP-binding protein EngB required for normal cell division
MNHTKGHIKTDGKTKILADPNLQIAQKSEENLSKIWESLLDFPLISRNSVLNMVEKLRSIGMNSIRILFLGKTGTGKSSTINSFLGEKYASDVGALHGRATDEVITFTRVLEGFSFVIIDTPGLIEGNILSETTFRKIKDFLVQPGNTVDIVMFCERIDIYRIEPIDRKVIDAVNTLLGKDIWRHAMFVFTRAYVVNSPNG